MPSFEDFLSSFFSHFTQKQFRGNDFLSYLQRPNPRRAGDEASIVDNTIVGPLLSLLGFAPGEQVYNQNNKNGRPDFAPTVGEFGVCFVVEDKSTGLDLTLDLSDPESNLSQLTGYLRSLGLRSGWLTNGRRLMVWRMDNPENPECTIDLSVSDAVKEWVDGGGQEGLTPEIEQALRVIWEQFRKETFSDLSRLEREIATDRDVWEAQALPLGANTANQDLLVGAVKTLLQDLQADARNLLDTHLNRHAHYARLSERLEDNAGTTALEDLEQQRNRVLVPLEQIAALVGLTATETDAIKESLKELQRNPRAFLNTKELLETTLKTINIARERKFVGAAKPVKAWSKYDNGLGPLGEALQAYGDTAFVWHQRQAILRHDNREAIEVQENYALWTSIVQETMLGGMNESQRRDEFALQAAYVVFIRLLLIRVCEDKGILPHRFLSDGGLKRWQEDIERYFAFATGNPYDTLLDMAFQNAQNIYAHFFTGRELFNWYSLNRLRFVRVLHQLSRFNFADVDSDLIGTIYSTYVGRPEKKQKGQYYTPPEIVRYILDETGYVTGAAIIGSNKRLIDPACGSGTFLVEAARRLVASYKTENSANARQLLDRVRENLYGFDLNPFACYLAEVNLLIQVLDLVKLAIDGKNPPKLQRFHVYNVDALSPASGILYYARANTLMATEMDVVDRIKDRKEEYATGFSWVVANPPYGAGLTESYKSSLRLWWPSVFYGKPDTYVFFYALGLRLLSANGRMGFITPNTYLMGTNTAALRGQLLGAGRITQIVDLPQGIWKDANVDCTLLFLTGEPDAEKRKAQQTQVYSMAVRDTLEKLTNRDWNETLTQSQGGWINDQRHDRP
jgi:type I restriction enzyme M protein